MSLYAIGDLHLHFQSVLKAPGQLHGRVWKNHEQKFLKNCRRLITPEDTLVLAGDHSWGKNLAECGEDLQYIMDLPGRKILTRGNHDMFWEAKRTDALRQRYEEMYGGDLEFLQGSFAVWNDYALVATKGYTYEGLDTPEHAAKLVRRELVRLKAGLDEAKAAGFDKIIVFLHYPPTNILERESGFTQMTEDYGVSQVVYAHCHGRARFHDSVSGDSLDWCPKKIVDG